MSGSLSRIRLFAGSLACARTDGCCVSSGGRETFDFDSMLVAPWLAHSGVHRPRRRAHSLPSSYLGLAALSFYGCFSALHLHVSHVRLGLWSCIVFTAVLLTCCVYSFWLFLTGLRLHVSHSGVLYCCHVVLLMLRKGQLNRHTRYRPATTYLPSTALEDEARLHGHRERHAFGDRRLRFPDSLTAADRTLTELTERRFAAFHLL